ncbi:MAG: hypothetical protein HY658_14200 [Actinobacteria bacterium]|nr:hypothetical protein [Actinomycetota bacterium]
MRTEDDVRDLLIGRAEDVRADPRIPARVLGRARHRRALTAGLSVATAVVLSAGAWVGIRAALGGGGGVTPLDPSPSPSATTAPPVDTGWKGLWPQATRQEAEDAQACADDGDPACAWQVDIEAFLERYGTEELGWEATYFDEALDVGEPNDFVALALTIYSCDVLNDPCPGYDFADVRSERLVRHDPTGIWSVTEVSTGNVHGDPPEAFPPSEAEVLAAVDAFMQARQDGEGAEVFLSTEALARYESNHEGLHLYGGPAPDSDGRIIVGWEVNLLGGDPDDGSYSVEITIHLEWLGDSPPSTTRETLVFGPGYLADGGAGTTVVLGAEGPD